MNAVDVWDTLLSLGLRYEAAPFHQFQFQNDRDDPVCMRRRLPPWRRG